MREARVAAVRRVCQQSEAVPAEAEVRGARAGRGVGAAVGPPELLARRRRHEGDCDGEIHRRVTDAGVPQSITADSW